MQIKRKSIYDFAPGDFVKVIYPDYPLHSSIVLITPDPSKKEDYLMWDKSCRTDTWSFGKVLDMLPSLFANESGHEFYILGQLELD